HELTPSCGLESRMNPPTRDQIERWIVENVAERLQTSPAAIDANKFLIEYGFDSFDAVRLTGQIGEWLGVDVDPTLAYDFPTISTIAGALVEIVARDALARSTPRSA